ncbi:hypothetical protein [Rhizobium sullae]|uniref:hypothetical protein n=1 Tax=Rhizobium sullae TaxID=50338 RepID=UPI001FCCF3B6|nr:hypothetical protein [Rhizobium sullae]
MGEKRERVYHTLVEGVKDGLTDKELYEYVVEKCPKTSSKRIVRASLLALTDPDLHDRHILDVIYALAIKHRLDNLGIAKDDAEDDDMTKPARLIETAAPARAKCLSASTLNSDE